jgi:GAF domain-containing protein
MKKIDKAARYGRLKKQLEELLKDKPNAVAAMATVVAVLHHKMGHFFWTGFYLLDKGELIVGPYQGSLACIRLKKETGVCWAGVIRRETIVVPDVHAFPGHIACDSRSRSEIVVPLFSQNGEVVGVLDVDSKEYGSFDEQDAGGLRQIVDLISF